MKFSQELIDRTRADLELVRSKITAALEEGAEARKAIDRRTLLGEDTAEPEKRARAMEALRVKLEGDEARLESEVRRLEAGLAAQEARTLLEAWSKPARALGDSASKAAAAVHELVEVARSLTWPAEPAGNLTRAMNAGPNAPVLHELLVHDVPSWLEGRDYFSKLEAVLGELVKAAAAVTVGQAGAVKSAEAELARIEGGAA